MSAHGEEDAASFEEFAARSSIEQIVICGSTDTWKSIGLMLLSAVFVAVALAAAAVGAHDRGDLVIRLVLALIAAWLLGWPFGSVIRAGVRGMRQ